MFVNLSIFRQVVLIIIMRAGEFYIAPCINEAGWNQLMRQVLAEACNSYFSLLMLFENIFILKCFVEQMKRTNVIWVFNCMNSDHVPKLSLGPEGSRVEAITSEVIMEVPPPLQKEMSNPAEC